MAKLKQKLIGISNSKVLHIVIGKLDCCVPIDYIENVSYLPAWVQTPSTKDYVVGNLNYHNVAIPLIDMARYLQLDTASNDNNFSINTPIIILNDFNHAPAIAFTIEQFNNLFDLSDFDVAQSDNKVCSLPIAEQIIMRNQTPIYVLDIEKILKIEL